MKKLSIFLICFIAIANISFAFEKVKVYVFSSQNCPHCRDEKAFIQKIKNNHPDVDFVYFDVLKNRDHIDLYHDVKRQLNISSDGIPVTVIGKKYFVGFGTENTTGREIENAIYNAEKNPPEDLIENLKTRQR